MAYAEPGQVLLSKRLTNFLADAYQLHSLGPIILKGKTKAVSTFAALGAKQFVKQSPNLLFNTPLIGRKTELARLHELLNTSMEGKGQILHIKSKMGAGKSHFVAEFIKQATQQNVDVFIGTCQSTAQNNLYYSWRQIFYSLLVLSPPSQKQTDFNSGPEQQITILQQKLKEMNPDWLLRLPLLGDLLQLPIPNNTTTKMLTPELKQMALVSLAIDIILYKAAKKPILLVIEDTHWMDEASQELTQLLNFALSQAKVLLIFTSNFITKKDKMPLWTNLNKLEYYHSLTLKPLSKSNVSLLIENVLSTTPPPLLTDLIYAKTGGLTFFVKEWLNSMQQKKMLYLQEDGQWCLAKQVIDTLVFVSVINACNINTFRLLFGQFFT